jgi:predicted secreted protein
MFNKKILGLFLISFLLFGCKAQVPSFTEKQNGKTFFLETGERFVIRLKSRPITGYFWSVDIRNEKILTQNQNYLYDPDSALLGTSGKVVFHFRTLASGQSDLILNYLRPFEDKVPPIKTYKLHIIVK